MMTDSKCHCCCISVKDDEVDDDEVNETYEDSETYDEDAEEDEEDSRKPAALPQGGAKEQDDLIPDESSLEGDY
jgi:hypothetical protein